VDSAARFTRLLVRDKACLRSPKKSVKGGEGRARARALLQHVIHSRRWGYLGEEGESHAY